MTKQRKIDNYIIQILSKEFGDSYEVSKNEFDRYEVLHNGNWVCDLDEVRSIEIFETSVVLKPVYFFNSREDGYGDLIDSIKLTKEKYDYYLAGRFIA